MINSDILGWIGNIAFIIGAFLVAKKRVSGFYFNLLGAIFYIIIGFKLPLYSLVGIELILGSLNIYGIYNWKGEKK